MKRYLGYTLIEVLVSLTIIGLLFGLGYANFRDFSRRQQLVGLAKQIQGDLRLAQQMALSGQKPADCGDALLEGVRFGVTTSAPYVYRLRAVCGGNYPLIKEFYFTSDITPSPVTFSPNPIIFKVLGQGTNIPAGGSVEIRLTQTGTNNTSSVTVTSGGEIK